MYTFVRCQTNPECPDLEGWFLVLKPGDLITMMELHKAIASFYYAKFELDPHIGACPYQSIFYNPISLAARWLETIDKYLTAGETALVNRCGGTLPPHKVKILEEITSEEMAWPSDNDPDEIITISQWSDGKHYYLKSSVDRIFVPPKFDTLSKARWMAKKYTDNIIEV